MGMSMILVVPLLVLMISRTGSARVFIVSLSQCAFFLVCKTLILRKGHATAQTTGVGGHMATRFIPTVERESIDLVYVFIVPMP